MMFNMFFWYFEIYGIGILIVLVSDQFFYDMIYQECYMGLLEMNFDGFCDGLLIYYVEGFEGNFLLIYGMVDDNVYYQSVECFMNCLIEFGKLFDMMFYFNCMYVICEGKGMSNYFFELMMCYFEEYVFVGICC